LATDNPTKAKPETVHTSGGSTNAVLHLIAMAKACGLKLTVDDFQVSLSLSLSLSLTHTHTHTHLAWPAARERQDPLPRRHETLNPQPSTRNRQRVSDKIPFLADMKPSGKYVMEDVQNIGGTPGIMKYLISKNMFDDSQMTITGKTIAQNLESLPGLTGSKPKP
jgi:dihydroxyacid dehydratase/phosphogluconate dehydratase